MPQETTQLQIHRDVVRCIKCNRQNQVEIFPELKENKFICKYCQVSQNWKPSEKYKLVVGV